MHLLAKLALISYCKPTWHSSHVRLLQCESRVTVTVGLVNKTNSINKCGWMGRWTNGPFLIKCIFGENAFLEKKGVLCAPQRPKLWTNAALYIHESIFSFLETTNNVLLVRIIQFGMIILKRYFCLS